MAEVFIGLGTNLGNRLILLRAAMLQLKRHVDVTQLSPIYETEPVGYLDQPNFLNAVLAGRTDLAPDRLLSRLQEIEAALGRERSFPNAPRPIDLDLLFYDDLIVESDTLTIPHPRLHERLFVLAPLSDIAPDFFHPKLGTSVSDMRLALGDEWDGTVIDADLSDIVEADACSAPD